MAQNSKAPKVQFNLDLNEIPEIRLDLTPVDVNNVTFTPGINDWDRVEWAALSFIQRPTPKNRAALERKARAFEELVGPKDAAETWMRFMKKVNFASPGA